MVLDDSRPVYEFGKVTIWDFELLIIISGHSYISGEQSLRRREVLVTA